MNKLFALIQCIVLMTLLLKIPAAADDTDPRLSVRINRDGSVTVSIPADDLIFSNYDSVRIYKTGEWVTPGAGNNPPPLLWWFARPGRTVTYPGERAVPVLSSRAADLSAGEGSALAPGKYYAIILGRHDISLSEAVNFEIPEITEQPCTAPPSYPPSPTPVGDPPPVFLPVTPAAATPHRTPPVQTTPGVFYFGGDEQLRNGIAALAVIILAIITFFVMLHKRK